MSNSDFKSLALVEGGFRGTIEEQYGNIVWLSECMHAMGANHNLLLCGSAIAMASKNQKEVGINLSQEIHLMLPTNEVAVNRFLEKGANVWVLEKDLKYFGKGFKLNEAVELTDSIGKLCAEHDEVWFW